ncbi:hypothetical protein AMAG_11699 [Allomyces macrogynus ATCC 38327]|uniref:MIF4G domain-containing protein n=1 Tax=Allomyces macrogynus (strain ATCC 38327) TaxID=578462 RepID=A0A0L0SVS6_ALLM3|nr:hypothetical protein AMAG_11699 [Allomyces macrogynus ATCC 38327]|eukprot:KNE66571.1 hypothetical protein AMAG_11699 [Allomyces macrogynus ATCC 38327]
MDSTNDPPPDPSTMDDPTSPATTAPGPVSAADEQRLASFRDARRANLAALTQRAAHGRAANLDANMKKNMTFFKKLRLVTADNVATLLAELAKLKVDKYLAEITSALLENFTSGRKLPVADLDAILAITCQLHRRFTAQFTPGFVDALIGACALKPGGATAPGTTMTAPATAVSDATLEKAERERLAKNKPLLRVLTDLYLVGLLQPMAGNTIPDSLGDGSSTPTTIVAKPRGRDTRAPQEVADDKFLALIQELLVDRTHANLPLLATLVRFYAPVLFTEPADPPPGHTPDPAETLAPPVIQTKLSKAVNKYFDQLIKRLTSDQRALAKLQHKAREWAFERGTEAPEDMRQRLDRDQRVFETLSTQAQILATYLDRQMPVFDAKGDEDAEQASGTSITLHKMERKLDSGLWDDDEDRAFYQDLPELELMLPPALLQTAKTLKAAAAAVAAAGLSMPVRAADDGEDAGDQAGDKASDAAPATMDEKPPVSLETLEDDDDADQGKSRLDAEEDDAQGDDEEEEDSSSASQLAALLSRLPHCDNPALIDQAAVEFCYYNTRKAQRRLARVLVDVRQRGDMVALYARLLAILKRFEIADLVIDELDRTFRRQIRTTRQLAGPAALDASNAKLVSARYLSELVKFRLAPAPVVFFNLKLLLENVTPSNVETLSHFLEGCGRFLLADPATNARMAEVLEWVTRIKKRLTDTRLVLMVESAQAACQPRTPGSGAIKKKERSPEEEYILYLFTELTKPRVKYTIMQLRKFAWADEAIMDLMVKRFSKLKGVKFHQLEHVAAVLAGLCVYHPDLGIYVVDNLIEYIKSAMEARIRIRGRSSARNNYQENQMRTMKTAFLGHLYNAFVVDGNLIFAVLELLISFPFKDGPTEFFRIRLVAALLDVCGARLNKVRLDRFLIMFQLYIVCKNPLPMDVEFVVQDLFETLRPKMKRMTYEEAVEAAQELVGKQAKQQETVTSPTAADAADIDDAEPDLTGEGAGEADLSDAGSDGLGESDDEEDEDDDESDLSDSDDDLDDDLSDLSDLDDLDDDDDEEDEDEAEEDESAMLDRELQLLMSERPDPSSRRRPVAVTAIAIPDRHAAATRAVPGAAANTSSSAEPSLALLTKRGAKVVTREFTVPEDSELAQHVAQIRAREEAERLELKSYVLKYERRELEERAAEVAAANAGAGGRQGGKRVLWSNSGARGRT